MKLPTSEGFVAGLRHSGLRHNVAIRFAERLTKKKTYKKQEAGRQRRGRDSHHRRRVGSARRGISGRGIVIAAVWARHNEGGGVIAQWSECLVAGAFDGGVVSAEHEREGVRAEQAQ
ncbi:uncharacterized protein DS421_2g44240 [Arachis hypogaea]|nr:uncharacterized protein DS421_2g44240 [Arachis hypogaea]